MALEFGDIDTIHLVDGGQAIAAPFRRGETLEDLPEIPWETDTCKNGGTRIDIGSVVSMLMLVVFAHLNV